MEETFLEAVKEKMRQKGYKITGPRLAIIRYLTREKGHPDIQEIFEDIRVEKPGIGMATVYRTVSLLLELGILRAITLRGHHLRYELNWPDHHHHHLVCNRCGQVTEFGNCNFQLMSGEIEQVTRFKIEEHALEAYGLCPQCLSARLDYSTENI